MSQILVKILAGLSDGDDFCFLQQKTLMHRRSAFSRLSSDGSMHINMWSFEFMSRGI